MFPDEIERLHKIHRWTIVLLRANQIVEASQNKRAQARVVEAYRKRRQAVEQLKCLGPWPVLTEEVGRDALMD